MRTIALCQCQLTKLRLKIRSMFSHGIHWWRAHQRAILQMYDLSVLCAKSDICCVCLFCIDTDYISTEEEQKVEQMLTLLTEESKQAAASTAVSTHTQKDSSNHNQPFLTPVYQVKKELVKLKNPAKGIISYF